MKKFTLFLSILFVMNIGLGQQAVLKKGTVLNGLRINDSIPDTYSLYLPTQFNTQKNWPLLLVLYFDVDEKETTPVFANASEKEGFVLTTLHISDTVSLSNNMIKTSKVLEKVTRMLPINKGRVYTAGIEVSGRYASLTPFFIRGIQGVVTVNASISNTELLNVKQPIHFIGIVDKNNYNYTTTLTNKKVLDRLRFPNQILLIEDGGKESMTNDLRKAMQFFNLRAMAKGWVKKDTNYLNMSYKEDIDKVELLKNKGKLLPAEQYLSQMFSVYGAHKNLDSLRQVQKELRRNSTFKSIRRSENATFLKESLMKEDYMFYLEEDVLTHNFNNLGWWNYQMTELQKFISGPNVHEKRMGNRLLGFVNALVEDNIDLVESDDLIDEDSLAFLFMLKTLTDPKDFDYYLKIISLSAKNEDFGTSLFYLEEALKKDFKDVKKLYSLENTALLRINPEFNKLVDKYLDKARYDINEE